MTDHASRITSSLPLHRAEGQTSNDIALSGQSQQGRRQDGKQAASSDLMELDALSMLDSADRLLSA